jgi:16S rRNA (uracil1498-N3)-methyltransferase
MSVRLYVDAALQRDSELDLPAAAARHVQVRRLQPSDPLRLFNGQGGEWAATVLHMGRSQVRVRIQTFVPVERELALRITVALGMPANERMDLLVEKATELGVHSIQPLHCERSVLRLAGERAERKRVHWQGIAAAAAEQCGRTRVPEVAAVLALDAFLAQLPGQGGSPGGVLQGLRDRSDLQAHLGPREEIGRAPSTRVPPLGTGPGQVSNRESPG